MTESCVGRWGGDASRRLVHTMILIAAEPAYDVFGNVHLAAPALVTLAVWKRIVESRTARKRNPRGHQSHSHTTTRDDRSNVQDLPPPTSVPAPSVLRTHRCRAAEETLALLKPHLTSFGITR